MGPKILQGAFAAVADLSTRALSQRILGPRYVDTAVGSLFSRKGRKLISLSVLLVFDVLVQRTRP